MPGPTTGQRSESPTPSRHATQDRPAARLVQPPTGGARRGDLGGGAGRGRARRRHRGHERVHRHQVPRSGPACGAIPGADWPRRGRYRRSSTPLCERRALCRNLPLAGDQVAHRLRAERERCRRVGRPPRGSPLSAAERAPLWSPWARLPFWRASLPGRLPLLVVSFAGSAGLVVAVRDAVPGVELTIHPPQRRLRATLSSLSRRV